MGDASWALSGNTNSWLASDCTWRSLKTKHLVYAWCVVAHDLVSFVRPGWNVWRMQFCLISDVLKHHNWFRRHPWPLIGLEDGQKTAFFLLKYPRSFMFLCINSRLVALAETVYSRPELLYLSEANVCYAVRGGSTAFASRNVILKCLNESYYRSTFLRYIYF